MKNVKFLDDCNIEIQNSETAFDLYQKIRDLTDYGISMYKEEIFQEWCKHNNFSENQTLLVMSTLFPQKALQAIIEFYKNLF